MTVRPEVVVARLAELAVVLAQLARLAKFSAVEREADPLHTLALERALHIAAEAIFDIGHHVLAGRGLAVPSRYRDVLPALVSAGVIEAALAQRLEGLAGLRNILVHDYVTVDRSLLWRLAEERLADLSDVHAALSRLPELGSRP